MRIAALAAMNGVLAVVFGTSGAHFADGAQAKAWLATAAAFQLAHAAAALAALALLPGRAGSYAALAMSLGALVFGSALAGLAFDGPRWLAAIAPGGGTLMMLGWLLLAARFATLPRRR